MLRPTCSLALGGLPGHQWAPRGPTRLSGAWAVLDQADWRRGLRVLCPLPQGIAEHPILRQLGPEALWAPKRCVQVSA